MDENDIEDVSFLPGDTRAHKKSVYEPSGSQRCRQIICSRNKAMAATVTIGILILAIALFAAFARPVLHPSCPVSGYNNNNTATTDSTTQPKTENILDTNGKMFPWQDIRLPKDIVPESYHIFMHPNISESWFKGRVEMTLQIVKPTDFIIFHIKDMNITSHTVKYINGDKNNEIMIKDVREAKKLQQYYLQLDATLTKDQRVLVTVEFRAPLISKLAGFYKSTYKTKNNESRSIATTHFEATDARAAFPCLDEPELKANFTLHMVRDPYHVGLFNMPLVETVAFKGNELLLEDHFQTSVKMSTYLVAFVVCDFSNLTSHTKSNVMVRVFAPTDVIQQAKFALETAVKILDHYDTFFGIKYPLPKQDLIAVPDFAAGAMENWGLITYRTTSILYDPAESSASSQQWVAIVIAHELAHQWFGNLVTMKWWNDLWLNEGFASFVEYIGANIINPGWKLFDQFVSKNLLGALNLDSLSNSHPIQVEVSNPDQISEIFDSISYDKGSSILRMLQNFLGMEDFQKGLHAYLLKYSYSNTVTTDLWSSLTQVSVDKGLDVTKIMNTWTKQMGYPVISLTRNGNQIEATQKHFLLYPGQKTQLESQYGYKWYVPLNYVTSVKPKSSQIVWMNMTSVSFEIPAETEWLKANYEMYGFYRVNYDDNMWTKLIQLMKTNHLQFSGGDRAGLIDDAYALSRAGLMEQTTALDLSKYLVKERDYVPWSAAISNIRYIGRRLLDSQAYDDYKEFFLNLISPLVDILGWNDTGSHLDKYLRQSVLGEAVYLGNKAAVAKAKELFYQWMNEDKSLPANLKTVVYMAGVKYGGQEEWKFCWNRYLTTNVASEKKLMLHALAATTEISLLTRFLQYSLDMTKIRSQDCSSVISSVAVNPYGRLLAWRFVRKNWEQIKERMGNGLFTSSTLIKSTSSSFSTRFDYDEVKAFFSANSVGSGVRAVKQALESIEMNIDWLDQNEAKVTAWLQVNKNFPDNQS